MYLYLVYKINQFFWLAVAIAWLGNPPRNMYIGRILANEWTI